MDTSVSCIYSWEALYIRLSPTARCTAFPLIPFYTKTCRLSSIFFDESTNHVVKPCYSSAGEQGVRWGLLERSPQTPKNFQKRYCAEFGALFCHIFAVVFPEEPALLLPKIIETPSRGPLSPLYGGKEGVLRGEVNCNYSSGTL